MEHNKEIILMSSLVLGTERDEKDKKEKEKKEEWMKMQDLGEFFLLMIEN